MVTPSILVVEDEGITALAIQNTLKGFGYTISGVASTGEEALQKIHSLSPDLVLMDIHLRGEMDGIQTATKLRQEYDIPVIFLSAYTDPQTVKLAIQAEPYAYLAKPFSEQELYTTIEATIYRHQLDKALREREQGYATLFQSLREGVIVTDSRGHITFMNQQAESLTGLSTQKLVGQDVLAIFPDLGFPDPDHNQCLITQLFQSGSSLGPVEHQVNHITQGKTLWLEIEVFPIQSETHIVTGASIMFRDITNRKQTEQTLTETYERLRQFSHRLTNAEEEERKHVARELHDEFGHLLTALKLDLTWLRESLPQNLNSSPEPFFLKIDSMMRVIDSIIETVRDLTAFLRPTFLDQVGLLKALYELGGSLESQTSIQCHLHIPHDLPLDELDVAQTTTLYRITQELLTNIKKHAQASNVHIALTQEDHILSLVVRDDGNGLVSHPPVEKQSFGLEGIEERVWLLGGSFNIEGISQEGTIAVVKLPWQSPIT